MIFDATNSNNLNFKPYHLLKFEYYCLTNYQLPIVAARLEGFLVFASPFVITATAGASIRIEPANRQRRRAWGTRLRGHDRRLLDLMHAQQ